MQKSNRNASILIWSIFISLIVSITFISISTKINKTLKENKEVSNDFTTNNDIENKIKETTETKEFNNILNDSKIVIFEPNNYYEVGLKKDESIKIFFPAESTGSIVSSSTISYNSLSGNGIINNTEIITASGELIIQNLSGYNDLKFNFSKNFETSTKKYKIYEVIGNKKVLKEAGVINNF